MRARLPILAFASAILSVAPLSLAQQQPQSQPGQQQNPPSSSSPSTPNAPTPAPARKHTTAEDNPFPEDISRKAATGSDDAPDAPAPKPASAPADKPPSSSDKPSPSGDKSTSEPKPSAPANKPARPDYSSSRSQFENIDAMGDDSPISNGHGGYVINLTLAAKDDKVGQYYLQNGDYQGAYSRFKEATEVNPGDADAVFGLAEAARGLKRKDEAVANYTLYLDVVPDGGKAKAARKALAELGAGPKH